MTPHINRRLFLGAGLATLAAPILSTTAVAAQPRRSQPPANGWPLVDDAPAIRIEGSLASITCVPGDTADILCYVARRWNYEATELIPSQVTGLDSALSGNPDALYETNIASGTSIDLLGDGAPAGATGVIDRPTSIVVRDILASCAGVVAWGGDMLVPREGYFQIDVPPHSKQLTALAARIRNPEPQDAPGTVDPFTPERRQQANRVARSTTRSRRR